jgi:hypothetical protein
MQIRAENGNGLIYSFTNLTVFSHVPIHLQFIVVCMTKILWGENVGDHQIRWKTGNKNWVH